MDGTQLKQSRTFNPDSARARIDLANPEYQRAFAALDAADQLRISNALGRLVYYCRNMGINSACELLAKLGWFINSGGRRG